MMSGTFDLTFVKKNDNIIKKIAYYVGAKVP
jgi:hypothetical protein